MGRLGARAARHPGPDPGLPRRRHHLRPARARPGRRVPREARGVGRRPAAEPARGPARLAARGRDSRGAGVPHRARPRPGCAIFEGAQFYFPDFDTRPIGDFPGPRATSTSISTACTTRSSRSWIASARRAGRSCSRRTTCASWRTGASTPTSATGSACVERTPRGRAGRAWCCSAATRRGRPGPRSSPPTTSIPIRAASIAGHSLHRRAAAARGRRRRARAAPRSRRSPSTRRRSRPRDERRPRRVPDLGFGGLIRLLAAREVGRGGLDRRLLSAGRARALAAHPDLRRGRISSGALRAGDERAAVGMFLDDDFSSFAAFRASMGFSDDGAEHSTGAGRVRHGAFYKANPAPNGALRSGRSSTTRAADLPAEHRRQEPGLRDAGQRPALRAGRGSARRTASSARSRSVDDFRRTQFGKANGFEWYFSSGRPNLDFSYGRDSSALVAEHLAAVDPSDEGPLVVTQNATCACPVIAIGGSNGLTPGAEVLRPLPRLDGDPGGRQEVHIIEGYAHLDVLTARKNEAVPLIEDWSTGCCSGSSSGASEGGASPRRGSTCATTAGRPGERHDASSGDRPERSVAGPELPRSGLARAPAPRSLSAVREPPPRRSRPPDADRRLAGRPLRRRAARAPRRPGRRADGGGRPAGPRAEPARVGAGPVHAEPGSPEPHAAAQAREQGLHAARDRAPAAAGARAGRGERRRGARARPHGGDRGAGPPRSGDADLRADGRPDRGPGALHRVDRAGDPPAHRDARQREPGRRARGGRGARRLLPGAPRGAPRGAVGATS